MIINLTPHTVNVIADDGTVKASYQSHGIARAKEYPVKVGDLNGIELVRMNYGEPEDLPVYSEGIYYIVSIITANAAKASGRTTEDLLITNTPVRDEEGRIIGCKKFAVIS